MAQEKLKPTLRSLAAEAGVSAMAVSLALRNSPGVSNATRGKIQQLAERRGYRPDPTISRLMAHLRGGRTVRFRANLCGISDRWPSDAGVETSYRDRLLFGLRQRADALGYGFELVHLDDFASGRPLQRRLFARGIQGLVILPLLRPRDLVGLLNWNLFATVTVTSSLVAPRFNGVSPQHFDNMLLACQKLAAMGRQRIGLVLPRDWDLRVNHRWTGAITWQNHFGGTHPVPPFISNESGPGLDVKALMAWVIREKPDVVISDQIAQPALHEAIGVLPRHLRPQLVTLNSSGINGQTGIDQQVEEIGSTAIDMLASMILHSEKGVPAAAHTTMILGRWVPGRATHSRQKPDVAGSRPHKKIPRSRK